MTEPHSYLEIKLKKADRMYRPGDTVDGIITVNAYKGWSHQGINLTVDGVVYLSSTSKGIMALGSEYVGRQIKLISEQVEVCGPGKFADGPTEVPFEFVVRAKNSQQLFETYHGVYISVIYSFEVTCDRGMMKKSLARDLEFFVEIPTPKSTDPVPASFNISPESLENVDPSLLESIPKFRISGRLHRSSYPIFSPFTGELTLHESKVPIRSLDLQLIRVESVVNPSDGKFSREATEVQNIQIGDGDICRDVVVPMYMVFPRLFSCPTTISTQFKIEFEVNLVISFVDGYMITENFPITLSRDAK